MPGDLSGQAGRRRDPGPEILLRVPCADKMWQWLSWPGDRPVQNEGRSQSVCNNKPGWLWPAPHHPEPVPPSLLGVAVAEHLSGQLGLACARAESPAGSHLPRCCSWLRLTLGAGAGVSSLSHCWPRTQVTRHVVTSSADLPSLQPPAPHPPFSVLPCTVMAALAWVTDHPTSKPTLSLGCSFCFRPALLRYN